MYDMEIKYFNRCKTDKPLVYYKSELCQHNEDTENSILYLILERLFLIGILLLYQLAFSIIRSVFMASVAYYHS
jgi:hypothetical protein